MPLALLLVLEHYWYVPLLSVVLYQVYGCTWYLYYSRTATSTAVVGTKQVEYAPIVAEVDSEATRD